MKINIKKSILPTLAAALILTACGAPSAENNQTNQEEAQTAPTSESLYSALTESGSFSELVPLDSDYMLNYFGIDVAEFNDYAAGEALDVMNADAIIILNTDDTETAKDAAEKLTAYKERKTDELKTYNPSELQKTEAAEVKTKGTFTYILICDDPDGAEDVLEGYID